MTPIFLTVPVQLARNLREPPSLIVATAIWLAALAWVRPLALPEEARYTDIARWMAISGDWLIPRIDGLPFLHKPPLYFWLEAAAIRLLGPAVFVDRLVSLASAALICACVFSLVRRFADDNAARWSIATLALNPLFYAGAQFGNLDMLVAALITATITSAVFAVQSPGRAHWLWLAAYVAAGLAVLAKGLIGVVLPGLVFLVWSLAARRPDWLGKAASPLGMAAFWVIVLPWFYAVEQKFPGFTGHFIGHHHFARFAGSGFNNELGLWFYPTVLFIGMLPWSLALLLHWRPSSTVPIRHEPLRLLGLVWFPVILVFFSLPRSKLIGYIFPLLPAFAILVGPWLASYQRRRSTATIGAALCVCAALVAAYVLPTGPLSIAAKLGQQIALDDEVIFVGGYLFDVAILLNRRKPIYVVGDWSRRAVDLPDSIRRQFTEGREIEPEAGYVLIGQDALKSLLSAPTPVWVWGEKSAVALDPDLKRLSVAATQGTFVLLHHGD